MRFGLGIGVVMCGAGLVLAAEAGANEAAPKVNAKPVVVASTVAAKADATGGGGSALPAQTAITVPAKPKVVAPTLIATIELSAQRMQVTANGRAVASWPISSGATGFETPTGRFRPKWASKMHYSRKYDNAPMPYSVFFNGGIATHGTTATGRLGSPASHGCIRLRTANARAFYELVHAHGYGRTRIVVRGTARQTRVAARHGARGGSGGARLPQRRNSFAAPAQQWGNSYVPGRRSGVRYTVYQYDRALKARQYAPRRRVFPGDRW